MCHRLVVVGSFGFIFVELCEVFDNTPPVRLFGNRKKLFVIYQSKCFYLFKYNANKIIFVQQNVYSAKTHYMRNVFRFNLPFPVEHSVVVDQILSSEALAIISGIVYDL